MPAGQRVPILDRRLRQVNPGLTFAVAAQRYLDDLDRESTAREVNDALAMADEDASTADAVHVAHERLGDVDW